MGNQMIDKQIVASQNRWWYNRCGAGQRGRRFIGNTGCNKGRGRDGGCPCRQHFKQAFSFHRRCVDVAIQRAEAKSMLWSAELDDVDWLSEDAAAVDGDPRETSRDRSGDA